MSDKKILLINGSLSGKSSRTLPFSRALALGIAGKLETKVSQLTLTDIKYKPCVGCQPPASWGQEAFWDSCPCMHPERGGSCLLDPKWTSILDLYRNADVIIWSFGFSGFGFPSSLSAFLEKLTPLATSNLKAYMQKDLGFYYLSRYDLSHQKHIIIGTAGQDYDRLTPFSGDIQKLTHVIEVFGSSDITSFTFSRGEFSGENYLPEKFYNIGYKYPEISFESLEKIKQETPELRELKKRTG